VIAKCVVALFLLGASLQSSPLPADSTYTLITVEARKGAQADTKLRAGDVMVYESRERVPVGEVTPLAGQPLELYVLIDDALGDDFGVRLDDVRKFVNAQTANTAVGIAYMRNGTVDILQQPTTDHAAAAKALRLPLGTTGTSPYESMTELLKRWPPGSVRHEIVMISSGIEPFGGNEFSNPQVDAAIAAVQRAVVPVFVIYAPPSGHSGHSFWRTNWGQTYLSRLADESGGESYDITGINVVSYAPYLDDITQRLQRQYRVAFTPKPQSKPGFVPIRASTEVPHIDLVTPDRAWVGGGE
jgi:hypothetical protein